MTAPSRPRAAQTVEDLLTDALRPLAAKVARDVREGSVTFKGVSPLATPPVAGRTLDADGAIEAIRDGYLSDDTIEVPVDERAPKSTQGDLDKAMQAAAAAVAAPVDVSVGGKPLQIRPADIAGALSYAVTEEGGLAAKLDGNKVLDALGARLEAVEQLPRDATFDVSSGHPVLVPSRDGRTVSPDERPCRSTSRRRE